MASRKAQKRKTMARKAAQKVAMQMKRREQDRLFNSGIAKMRARPDGMALALAAASLLGGGMLRSAKPPEGK